VRDWPGLNRTLVHCPDPLASSALVDSLALRLAPTHRVLSLAPRPDVPYQVATMDLLGVLDQFGFPQPVVVGERLGCLPVVLVAAWYPYRVGQIILVDPTRAASGGNSVVARALRECPPDWAALRARLACDVLELAADDPLLVARVEAVLAAPLP
jgi:pimeloyl-ACP methyl ester carboxylesterase